VGDGRQLLGLITRETLLIEPGALGSLNVWEITRYLSGLKVKRAMIKAREVLKTNPNATIEDAAQTMVENKIGCLPVIEGRIVVGMITTEDLLAHMTRMMVTEIPGVRATIRVPNVRGEVVKVLDTISAKGWEITTCLGVPVPKDPSKWDAVIKVRDVPKEELVAVLKQHDGHEILDIRET
jgi:CBS domain-containing protein